MSLSVLPRARTWSSAIVERDGARTPSLAGGESRTPSLICLAEDGGRELSNNLHVPVGRESHARQGATARCIRQHPRDRLVRRVVGRGQGLRGGGRWNLIVVLLELDRRPLLLGFTTATSSSSASRRGARARVDWKGSHARNDQSDTRASARRAPAAEEQRSARESRRRDRRGGRGLDAAVIPGWPEVLHNRSRAFSGRPPTPNTNGATDGHRHTTSAPPQRVEEWLDSGVRGPGARGRRHRRRRRAQVILDQVCLRGVANRGRRSTSGERTFPEVHPSLNITLRGCWTLTITGPFFRRYSSPSSRHPRTKNVRQSPLLLVDGVRPRLRRRRRRASAILLSTILVQPLASHVDHEKKSPLFIQVPIKSTTIVSLDSSFSSLRDGVPFRARWRGCPG